MAEYCTGFKPQPWNKKFLLEISSWAAIGFQNASSPLMEQLIFFHDHTITILILITNIVAFNIISTLNNKTIDKLIIESQPLELFWTITPTFILVFIGIPSIRLLYLLDEVYSPAITIKTIGHQWYWSYEYSDFINVEFDSYLLNSRTEQTNFRLLDVDNRTTIPINSQIRILISAADVLHSWTIPRLGVKVDAIPGRLNQINFNCSRPGLFFGQCSEICGANHSFMPICIESIPTNFFIKWVKKIRNSLNGWK
jgi:cytochrome c oxidase subunit 2